MESTLRVSEFGDDLDIDERDPEIEALQNQVAETESTLLSITSAAQLKQEQYQSSLKSLQNEIESAKHVAEEALARQKAENAEALDRLRTKLDREMMEIESQVRNSELQNSLFEKTHQEIHMLGEMTKVHDLQRKVEQERSRLEETTAISAVTRMQQTLRMRDSRNTAIMAVKRLEQEISELQATRRELHSALRLKSSDLMAQMEIKRRDHGTFMRNMRRTMEERDARYATHIKAVKDQIERERIDGENDMKTTAEKCENLQKILQAVSRRGNRQLAQLEKDIERMKRTVASTRAEEQRNEASHIEQIARLQTLSTETAAVRNRAVGINQELMTTRARNAAAVSTLRKSEARAAAAKTTARHYKNSIFS